jgi:peptidylprolyl isomerase
MNNLLRAGLSSLLFLQPLLVAQDVKAGKVTKAEKPDASSSVSAAKKEKKMEKTESGLQYEDLVVGTGESPKKGNTCVMHYTGWLFENGEKGEKFDSSLTRESVRVRALRCRLRRGLQGVGSMKAGGKRTRDPAGPPDPEP